MAMNLIETQEQYDYFQKHTTFSESDVEFEKHIGLCFKSVVEALLEYRRANNIFEVGDRIILGGSPLIHQVHKLSGDSDDMYLLGWGWSEKRCIKHATDDEIKAEKRL